MKLANIRQRANTVVHAEESSEDRSTGIGHNDDKPAMIISDFIYK